MKKSESKNYPVLPLRDIVVFPHMAVPLFVGRAKSVHALERAMEDDKRILLLTQKSAGENEPKPDDVYRIGTLANILQLLKLPDGTVKVLVEGICRVETEALIDLDTHMDAVGSEIESLASLDDPDMRALVRATTEHFEEYVKSNKKIPPEIAVTIAHVREPDKLADTIASHLALKIDEKQKLLEVFKTSERFERLIAIIEDEMSVQQVERRIKGRVKKQMEKSQREYYLNEQLKAIQKELNENGEGEGDEITEYEKKVAGTKLSKEAREKATNEIRKLRQMPPMSAEATVIRNYLDWILGVPWDKKTKVRKDIAAAKKILDTDHYGLEKVKERILEYLAVQQRTGQVKGSILCLVGPPGVGKTSLGQSIAKATGRNFVRMSLGGVRDESEIRGHRRTYIGALPGKVVQGMKKAKTVNPLFLLDEIDKLGADWRGDPSAALLEVLDPEQNATFNDHYLELDYNLSDVMFICTANSMRMPQPLLDRMEIIRLSGYTEDEKLEIVKRHLLQKQTKLAGLKRGEFSISDSAIRHLIRHYTREAGVRSLEREIANLCRKAVKDILLGKRKTLSITPSNIGKYAGVERYKYGEIDTQDRIGIVTGLAWTETGGDLLSIEAVTMPGKDGKVSMTGNLQDVMKESIIVAEMLVKSRSAQFGIDYDVLKTKAIHVHVPEGATPKDGPSAGCAMVTAIVSALTGIDVRRDVAMTGEVNLRGHVTAIGGLKEKLLAALRGGIKKVLIPHDNVKDLEEIPANVKKELDIIPMHTITDVLAHALVSIPVPLPEKSSAILVPDATELAENNVKSQIHH